MAIIGKGLSDVKRILEENGIPYKNLIGLLYKRYKAIADKIFITAEDPWFVGDPDRFTNFLKIYRVAIKFGDRELSVIEQLTEDLQEILVFCDADITIVFFTLDKCTTFIDRYMTKPNRDFFHRYPDNYEELLKNGGLPDDDE